LGLALSALSVFLLNTPRTLKRAQIVQFSEPYMCLEHSLLVNRLAFAEVAREQSVSQAVRSFTGTVGVLAGSA